jgi:hypothetical protein
MILNAMRAGRPAAAASRSRSEPLTSMVRRAPIVSLPRCYIDGRQLQIMDKVQGQ